VIIRPESGSRWQAARIGDFEKWQAGLLEESASRLGAVLDPGGRVHRYGFVGSPVTFCGQRAWLRVSPFLEHEMSRKAWRGTAEAAVILGVSKPALLHRIEWHADGPEPVPVSAEVLTLVTDRAASRERFLRTAPDLPPEWFRDLAASLAALRAYPTDRRFPVHSPDEYGYLLSATYRRPVPASCVPAFETEHIDLNWENITAPPFLRPRHGALVHGGHGIRCRLPLPHGAGSPGCGGPGLRGAGRCAGHAERPVRPARRRRAHHQEPHPAARPRRPGGQAPRPHRHGPAFNQHPDCPRRLRPPTLYREDDEAEVPPRAPAGPGEKANLLEVRQQPPGGSLIK